jgi:hypothetical protein
MGDEFEDGDSVYANYNGRSSVYDSSDFGDYIGTLKGDKVVPKAVAVREEQNDDFSAICWDDAESNSYILNNSFGHKHILHKPSTDEARLNAHWEGFVENSAKKAAELKEVA